MLEKNDLTHTVQQGLYRVVRSCDHLHSHLRVFDFPGHDHDILEHREQQPTNMRSCFGHCRAMPEIVGSYIYIYICHCLPNERRKPLNHHDSFIHWFYTRHYESLIGWAPTTLKLETVAPKHYSPHSPRGWRFDQGSNSWTLGELINQENPTNITGRATSCWFLLGTFAPCSILFNILQSALKTDPKIRCKKTRLMVSLVSCLGGSMMGKIPANCIGPWFLLTATPKVLKPPEVALSAKLLLSLGTQMFHVISHYIPIKYPGKY